MIGPLQVTQQVSILTGTTDCDSFLSIQSTLLCSKLSCLHVAPKFDLGLSAYLDNSF